MNSYSSAKVFLRHKMAPWSAVSSVFWSSLLLLHVGIWPLSRDDSFLQRLHSDCSPSQQDVLKGRRGYQSLPARHAQERAVGVNFYLFAREEWRQLVEQGECVACFQTEVVVFVACVWFTQWLVVKLRYVSLWGWNVTTDSVGKTSNLRHTSVYSLLIQLMTGNILEIQNN